MSDEKLLPCPWCGSDDIAVKVNKTTIVECRACGGLMLNYHDGRERDVFAAWNRRVAQRELSDEEIVRIARRYATNHPQWDDWNFDPLGLLSFARAVLAAGGRQHG